MSIEMAGILFSISCRYPVIFDKLSPTYRTFTENLRPAGCDIKVSVVFETDDIPDTGKMEKIFDTEQSWSLFRQDDDYFLSLNSPAFGNQVIWMAHFGHTFEEITIYCGNLLINRESGRTTVSSPLSYPLDQLLLMYILATREGALIHAAGMHINGKGFIFPGKSGAGKSTLSRLFIGRDNIRMLSDDRVVARKIKGRFEVFGTPWAGDAGIAENKHCPLYGIFFIHHAGENMIREIKPRAAIERLMPVTSIPWYDEKTMSDILSFCEDLVFNVPAYELHFKPDKEVVDFLEKFVSA